MPKKPGGATPTMITAVLLTVTRLPTTAGSRPNRRCQNSWLITATGSGLAGLSSASVSARPTTAPTPRTEKKLPDTDRSEEHTSELQSLRHLVCRLLLEKNNSPASYVRA